MVGRIKNNEPIIFGMRERDDEVEDHGIRVIHFYIGDVDGEANDGRLQGLTSQMMNHGCWLESELSVRFT